MSRAMFVCRFMINWWSSSFQSPKLEHASATAIAEVLTLLADGGHYFARAVRNKQPIIAKKREEARHKPIVAFDA